MFSKPKPKLARDYEEERRQIEALKETQRKNEEWNKLESEKNALKEQLSAEKKAKFQKEIAPLKKAGASIEHGFVKGLKFGLKEFNKSQQPKRRHHRRHRRKAY